MLKEIRELVSFVLSYLDDLFRLMRFSVFSISPSARLGSDSARALHVSAVVGIILLSAVILTRRASPTSIEILTFSLACLSYFVFVSLIITTMLRVSIPATVREQNSIDASIDAHSYVLSFNLLALFVFALLREVAVRFVSRGHIKSADWIAAGITVAVTSLLFFGFPKSNKNPAILEKPYRLLLAVLLSVFFVIYTQILVFAH